MLNETCLQNLDPALKNVFDEYVALDKPTWKRVDYKYEEPAEFKAFNNVEVKNDVQDGIEVKNIKDAVNQVKKLENDNKFGLGKFFKLQNIVMNNAGKYVKVKKYWSNQFI